MADRCRSCDAFITWALSPTGAKLPLSEERVWWPLWASEVPKKREDLPENVQAAVGSKPTAAYEFADGHATKIGDFYIVKGAGIDEQDVSKRLVSHYATCPQAGQWSGKGRR